MKRATPASPELLAYLGWMENLEGMDCQVSLGPKALLGPSWLKVNVGPQASLGIRVSLETGVHLAPQDLALKVHPERRVFRAFQVDLELLVPQVRKVNQAKLCQRRGHRVPEGHLETRVSPELQALQVSPDSLVSQGCLGRKVTQDSQALAYQVLLESKDFLELLVQLALLVPQVALVWMVYPVNQVSQGQRESPAMAYQDLRGLQDSQVRKGSRGQKVILDSQGPLASLGDQALMEHQAPKVTLVFLAHLVLVALQVPLHLASRGLLVLLAVQVLWVHLDFLGCLERRETLVPQGWTSRGCQEIEGARASLELRESWVLRAVLEHQAEMDFLAYLVQRETWELWEPLDQTDSPVPLGHQAFLDQKVTTAFLDGQVVQVVQG